MVVNIDTDNGQTKIASTSEMMLFFACGVSVGIGWNVVLSCLVYYTETLGIKSFVYLNLASNIPLVPISLAQMKYDTYMDRKYGNSLFTYSFRGFVAYMIAIDIIILMPWASFNLIALSLATLILGTSVSILFGTLQQMAVFTYKNCTRLPAAVMIGYNTAFLISLVTSIGTGFGSSGSDEGIYNYYFLNAGFMLLSSLSFFGLMRHSTDVGNAMSVRDLSLATKSVNDLALGKMRAANGDIKKMIDSSGETSFDFVEIESNQKSEEALTYRELWDKSWFCYLSVVITMVSTMMVASWMNRVVSVDPTNTSFPQFLYFVRQFSDFLGPLFTLIFLSPKATSVGADKNNQKRFLGWVGIAALLRAIIFTPLFFIYVSADSSLLPRNDTAVIAGLAIFCFSSYVITTLNFQRAPYLIVEQSDISVQTEQTNILSFCVAASASLGIIICVVLQEVGNF